MQTLQQKNLLIVSQKGRISSVNSEGTVMELWTYLLTLKLDSLVDRLDGMSKKRWKLVKNVNRQG